MGGGGGGSTPTGANISPGANAAQQIVAGQQMARTPAGMGAALIGASIAGSGNVTPHANLAQNPLAHQAGGLIPRFPASAGGGVNWGRMIGNAPMNLMFGGWEVGSSYMTGLMGQHKESLTANPVDALRIRAETIRGQHQGIIGSIFGGVSDLFGRGPASVMNNYESVAFRDRMGKETRGLYRDIQGMDADSYSAGSLNPIERLESGRRRRHLDLDAMAEPLMNEAGDLRSKLREVKKSTRREWVELGDYGSWRDVEVEEPVLQGGDRTAAEQKMNALGLTLNRIMKSRGDVDADALVDKAEFQKSWSLEARTMEAKSVAGLTSAAGNPFGAARGLIQSMKKIGLDAASNKSQELKDAISRAAADDDLTLMLRRNDHLQQLGDSAAVNAVLASRDANYGGAPVMRAAAESIGRKYGLMLRKPQLDPEERVKIAELAQSELNMLRSSAGDAVRSGTAISVEGRYTDVSGISTREGENIQALLTAIGKVEKAIQNLKINRAQ